MKPVDSDHAGAWSRPTAAPDTVATTRPYTPRCAVELADVVQQRGRQPARVVGVGRVGQSRLHVAGHADGVALVVVGLATELREAVGGEHGLHPGDVVGARRSRPQRPHEATGEVARSSSASTRNTQSKSWLMNGSSTFSSAPDQKMITSSTRIP